MKQKIKNRITFRILASLGFEVGQPVAVYWGDDEFYGGTIQESSPEELTVKMNWGDLETFSRDDFNAVVPTTKHLKGVDAYSKSDVAKVRLVATKSVDKKMFGNVKLTTVTGKPAKFKTTDAIKQEVNRFLTYHFKKRLDEGKTELEAAEMAILSLKYMVGEINNIPSMNQKEVEDYFKQENDYIIGGKNSKITPETVPYKRVPADYFLENKLDRENIAAKELFTLNKLLIDGKMSLQEVKTEIEYLVLASNRAFSYGDFLPVEKFRPILASEAETAFINDVTNSYRKLPNKLTVSKRQVTNGLELKNEYYVTAEYGSPKSPKVSSESAYQLDKILNWIEKLLKGLNR